MVNPFASALPPQVLRGLTVLLVEDHSDTREVIASQLRRSGAVVKTASSAQTAMLALETSATVPDLLVIDLALPDVDGWTLLAAVRRLRAECGGTVPAVAISAHHAPEDRRRSLLGGFRLHVAKPIEFPQFADLLAGMLRHWQG